MRCEICGGTGTVRVNGGYNRCECQRLLKTKELFRKSEIPERYFKRLNELDDQKILSGRGTYINYKQLIEELLKNEKKREALFNSEITLVLRGSTGSGKTQFASTLTTELLNYFNLYAPVLKTNKAYFLDVRNIGNFMFNNEEKARILKKVKGSNILIIDDLGVEQKNNEYIFSTLEEIIRNFKGFKIITTNLNDPKEVYEKKNKRLSSVLLSGGEADHGKKNVLYYTFLNPKNVDRRQIKIDDLNFE